MFLKNINLCFIGQKCLPTICGVLKQLLMAVISVLGYANLKL